ncbi:MAG: acetolactate decarboxylase [Chloroflexi bacterium]|nr:acetolactate decarboxylase [Chloroflexota bacterium]
MIFIKKPVRFIQPIILFLLSFSLVFISACQPTYATNPISKRDTITQISTFEAVLEGVYDGVMSFKELQQYGDFGIGTLDGLDGEMLEFDGQFYQIRADGKVYAIPDTATTPFASVTYFDSDYELTLTQNSSFTEIKNSIDKAITSSNMFCAIKITGIFTYVKTRSVPKQSKPYPLLTEVTKNQPEFEFTNISGTIVGYKLPQYAIGVNVPGYHLHFLNSEKTGGGHLLDLKIQEAKVYLDYSTDFLMLLPDNGSDFYKADLTGADKEDIENTEGK